MFNLIANNEQMYQVHSLNIDVQWNMSQHFWPHVSALYLVICKGTLIEYNGNSTISDTNIIDYMSDGGEWTKIRLGRAELSNGVATDSGGDEFVETHFHRTYNVPKRLRKHFRSDIHSEGSDATPEISLVLLIWMPHRDAQTAIRTSGLVTCKGVKRNYSAADMLDH